MQSANHALRRQYHALCSPTVCKQCLRIAAGVYADLDFESLRNLEPLLRGRQVLLAAMTAEAGFVHNIPNAWMASMRRHPFWLFVLQEITRTVGAGDFTRRVRRRARLLHIPRRTHVCMFREDNAKRRQMLGPLKQLA